MKSEKTALNPYKVVVLKGESASGNDASADWLSDGVLFPSFRDGAHPPLLNHISACHLPGRKVHLQALPRAQGTLPFSFLPLWGRFLLFVLGER